MAKVLIKELEPYRPLFIEEPVLAEQAEYYPKLAEQTHIPIAAGERMFSRFEFKRVLEAGGIAILQPDLSHAGGITECYKIAGMAEAYDVALAPHCPLGPIALAACLHVDFVSRNAVFQEQSMGIHYNKGAELLDFVKNKEDFSMEGGFFKPLTKPGLGVEIDEAAIEKCAERLMQLQDGSLAGKGDAVRSILSEELGIPDGISRSRNWVNEITYVLNEIQWKSTLTIRTGIGQSILLVTPIEAVRYVSAIANGGTVYNAHIVKNVVSSGGETLVSTEPSVFNKIDAPEEYWTAIRRGMAGVVSPEDGGTAGDAFSEEFEQLGYLAKISGKTGSAQVGNVTIDIQNTSWFVSFAPNDNPDIAICVCIPNGLSGSSSAGAIEDIMTYYFSKLDARSPETLAKPDDVTP